MSPLPIDEQLVTVRASREEKIDLLVQTLIAIDTLTDRLDVLLDRKREMA